MPLTDQEIQTKNSLADNQNPMGSNPNTLFANAQGTSNFSTMPTGLTKPLSPITPSNVTAPAAYNVNATLPIAPDNGSFLVNEAQTGSTNWLDNYNKAQEVANNSVGSSAQNNYDSVLNSYNDLLGLSTHQGADQLAAEQKTGVNDLNQQLAGLSGDIMSKTAAYNKSLADQAVEQQQMEAGAGARGLTTSMLLGQQGAVAKVRSAQNTAAAADIGIMQAQQLGLQGKAQAAQAAANRAVDLKYRDIESQIKVRQSQLEMVRGQLDKEDSKKAKLVDIQLQQQASEIADQKANDKEIQNMLIRASSQDVPQSILALAKKAKTPAEVAEALGVYSGDVLDRKLKLAQIDQARKRDTQMVDVNGQKMLIDTQTGKVVKNFGGGGGGAGANVKTSWHDLNGTPTLYNDVTGMPVIQNNGTGSTNVTKSSMDVKDTAGILTNIDSILNHKGLSGAVGANPIARISFDLNKFTNVRGNFIADVGVLTSQLTMDKLVNLKKAGGTLGALSDGERTLLANAATALNGLAKHVDDDPNKPVQYYNTSEANFKMLMGKIQNAYKTDFEKRNGITYDTAVDNANTFSAIQTSLGVNPSQPTFNSVTGEWTNPPQ